MSPDPQKKPKEPLQLNANQSNKPKDWLKDTDDIERAILGGLISQPDLFHQVRQVIKSKDFFKVKHEQIFSAIEALVEDQQSIDLVTLQERLRTRSQLELIGGVRYLAELEAYRTNGDVLTWAKLLENASLRRDIINVLPDIAETARDPEKTTERVAVDVMRAMMKVTNRRISRQVAHAGEVATEYLKKTASAQGVEMGIPWGIKTYDDNILGSPKGYVTVLGGSSGHAKTDLALNMMINMAKLGNRILFFSLEMSRERVIRKMLSIMSGVPHLLINQNKIPPEDQARFAESASRFLELPIYIWDTTESVTAWQDIETTTLARMSIHGVDAVFIDYFPKLVNSGGIFPFMSLEDILYPMGQLRGFARTNHLAVVALHQINKRKITSKLKRPDDMEFLEYGGETNADILVTNYLAYKHDPDANPHLLNNWVLKNRDMPTTNVKEPLALYHDGKTAEIMDWPNNAVQRTEKPKVPPKRGPASDEDDDVPF